jgi:hypothetical protein
MLSGSFAGTCNLSAKEEEGFGTVQIKAIILELSSYVQYAYADRNTTNKFSTRTRRCCRRERKQHSYMSVGYLTDVQLKSSSGFELEATG